MSGRMPLFETDQPKVLEVLKEFPLRDQALIIVGLNTGFRITELLSLTVGQVSEAGRVKPQVKVTRGKLKGGHGCRRRSVSSRTVPLNAAATAILELYLFARFGSGFPSPALPLFPGRFAEQPLSRWQANRIVHAVFEKAGLGTPECYGTHSLRKTFCRRVYEATRHDINLTRAVMGHTHITTTQKYLHVDEADVTAAVLAIATMPAAAPNAGPSENSKPRSNLGTAN